ncbi:MAG: S1C family serine protease [Dehalococcoidia bacterium]|nr:S1C family serine protease [Dehalococcoidia bacterium]
MTTESPSASLLARFSDELARAVEVASASVVSVFARRRSNPASGIVWTDDGVIVTADHALERDEGVTVLGADGRETPATIVGRDPGSDVAVLRAQTRGLTVAARGAEPKVGHFVLAVARPGGVAATAGVISAIGGPTRTMRGGRIEGFLRTDAVYYPGFSGGPLVDVAGKVLGMMTTHFGGSVAIPTSALTRTVETLMTYGRMKRGYLGITSQPIGLPEALRLAAGGAESGLLVVGVEANGPADRGGVVIGDILVSFAGHAVRDTDDLQALLTGERVGQPTSATVLRGGEPRTLTITVGERA